MKVSYNWLKEYIDIKESPEELSEILTDIGLEVEDLSIYKGPGNGLEGLVVGEVISVENHPDADKLKLTQVDVGEDEQLQIVCGAPNVSKGQKVIVAKVGTTLYPIDGSEFKIKKAKIRGVESFGMICAEDEIGMGNDHTGIMILPSRAKVGQLVKEHFGITDDYIFEIGLTPNRADAMGHIGVARDLQAALSIRNKKESFYELPAINEKLFKSKADGINVIVENEYACPRYSGILIKGVEVKESPNWLKEKLNAIGIRPISNIVDITNFVLNEFGQPLHAFDAKQVKGKHVIVKNLPDKSKFTTLDEVERSLDKNDLMICNAEEGMCIAGVFGGIKSGVKDDTRDIFLESAYFEPVTIRKTATRHNLRTDAATKFEKGTDPNVTITALKRATDLIIQLAGGEVASKIVDVYTKPVRNFEVEMSYANVDRLIGISIKKNIIKDILRKLEIEILKETKETLLLSIPPFKVDVQREADVIEEILRIYGFNNIPLPEKLNASLSYSEKSDKKEKLNNVVSSYLSSAGFNEMVANSISQSKYYESEGKVSPEVVSLLKSSNADLNILRLNMLYSGLEAISHNINHRNTDLKLFEFGTTYRLVTKTEFEETNHLTLCVSGAKTEESWVANSDKADFFYLKGVVDAVINRLGIENITSQEYSDNFIEYGLSYSTSDNEIVKFGALHQSVHSKFGIKQTVLYADFNWDMVTAIINKAKISYTQIPKFPGIRRDLALLLNKDISFREVQKIALEEGKRILKTVNLFDVYEDKNLGENRKSYAVGYYFLDEKKTLADKEVDKLMNRLIERYKNELKADIR